MKKLFKIQVGILLFIASQLQAQNFSTINLSAGYRTVEVGYTYNVEEFLNFGLSTSVSTSDMVEKRANTNDPYYSKHEFTSNLVPAVFGTVGATFDELTITGKMGGAYLEQKINDKTDTKRLWFAVGIRFEYNHKISISYDNVNSVLVGYVINLN